jgi:hypothetical protein
MMSYKEQIERRQAGLPPPCVETEKEPLGYVFKIADQRNSGERWM